MIETWIDNLAKIWEISDGTFNTVRSYRLIERAEFPASIEASELDRSPIALTIPLTFHPQYSAGGPLIGYWTGLTEFHVAPDVDKARMPSLMKWYGLILNAAAGHMKLSNSVELFLLADTENAIDGPSPLQYGAEPWHWGFVVQWQVKQRLEGLVTVSA